jgi:hypothetical protein
MPRWQAISLGQAQRSAQPAAAWTWSWRGSSVSTTPRSQMESISPLASAPSPLRLRQVQRWLRQTLVRLRNHHRSARPSSTTGPRRVRWANRRCGCRVFPDAHRVHSRTGSRLSNHYRAASARRDPGADRECHSGGKRYYSHH